MSSSSASSSYVPQGYTKVRVAANLGALFTSSRISLPPTVPQNILPFPFQQLEVGTPIQTLTTNFPNYSSPPWISSREATPSSSTSATPPIPIHGFLNMNDVVATQQVASVTSAEDANGQIGLPPQHYFFNNTTTAGPIRGSSRDPRPTPYTRPAASTSSYTITPVASGCGLSALAKSKLAVQGVCKINGCGEIFTSGELYLDHVRGFHRIMQGKNGKESLPCPWQGCGEIKTKGSLWNHLLGHNIRSGCGLCDEVLGVRSDLLQKHYRARHRDTHKGVLIPSSERGNYSYLFFCEGH